MVGLSGEVLIALVTAHLLGDFVLQTTNDVENKHKLWVLVRHTGLIALVSWVLCGLWSNWFIPAGIFVAHWAIDFVKSRLFKDGLYTFIIDQLMHLMVLVIFSRLVVIMGCPTDSYWVGLFGSVYLKLLVVISALIMITRMGGFLIGFMLKPMKDELEAVVRQQADPGVVKGLTNSALLIGQLERTLIFIFYLSGHLEGIGFLLAAKALLRFGGIKKSIEKMEGEYFFIGTLMSFGFGILVAIVTKMVLGAI